MPRYIDAELAKAEFTGNFQDNYATAHIKDLIDSTPTADVQPVVHGKWIDINNCGIKERKCSNCGKKDNPKTAIKGHYCWNCGAKMEVQPCQPQKA